MKTKLSVLSAAMLAATLTMMPAISQAAIPQSVEGQPIPILEPMLERNTTADVSVEVIPALELSVDEFVIKDAQGGASGLSVKALRAIADEAPTGAVRDFRLRFPKVTLSLHQGSAKQVADTDANFALFANDRVPFFADQGDVIEDVANRDASVGACVLSAFLDVPGGKNPHGTFIAHGGKPCFACRSGMGNDFFV